jgi:RNA polymerase sigma factor (sigma-70 family)
MKTQAGIVLRHLHRLAAPAAGGDVPDGQLLERFTARREEAAFAALVRRHGPMVLGVCRRVLRQEQDAEDAFQAAFLALARKAPSISKRDSVGSWLYQVAYHVAMKARERTTNRQQRERLAAAREAADPLAEISGRELLAVFDEELARLPERQRAPLVLCYLQGLTRDVAARQLGCSESTLHRRLDEARARLRERLQRRGLALPAALLAAGTVAATVPAALATTSVRSALGKASAVPAAVAALAREALRGAPRRTPKAVGALLLAAGLVAATVGLVAPPTPTAAGGDPPRAEVKPPNPPAPDRPADARAPEKSDLTVQGTVVGADGKPVPGAKVGVIALVERPYRGRVGERGHEVLGSGEADKEGRFRIDCAPATPSRGPIRQLLASAPGHGLGWLLLPRDAGKADVAIKLPAEQVIRGRLLDLQGQPAAGVKLHVAEVAPAAAVGTSSGSSTGVGGGGGTGSFTSGGGAPSATAPPWYDFPTQPAKLGTWPAAVTTDDEGRFTFRGIGKDQGVTLLVTDERFATQRVVVSTAAKDKPEAVERPLEPARWLEGQVVGDDTGKPIGKKVLLDFTTRGKRLLQVWADEKGHFRVNCPPGRGVAIESYPPDGSPYLMRTTIFAWPKGKTKHEIKVELPRGVLVRGKVIEADSGKPVAGAVLSYLGSPDNRFMGAEILSWHRFPGEFVRTEDDGTFTAAVYPGKGVLMAKGPTPDYVLERLDKMEPTLGKFAASLYADAAVPLDLKPDADAPPLALKMRRGVTVKGRVLDPDGKPVKYAVVYHPLSLQDQGDRAYFFNHGLVPVAVKDGTFTLTALDPKGEVPVYVLDRRNEIGGRLVVSGKSTGEEVTIKLQPCAKAKVRFVNAAGKPQAGHSLGLVLLLAPDARAFLQQADALGGWHAVGRSDKDGQVTVPGLIPGATYTYADGRKVREFTAEAGKTHDLGDVSAPMFGGGSGGGSE